MAFPNHLLPQQDYSKIAWQDELRQHFLLRTTPTSDIIDPETKMVRARFVLGDGQGRDNLKDYSTNLWGIYTAPDAAIQMFKGEHFDYWVGAWEPGEAVSSPAPDEYIVRDEFGCFFYAIGAIADFPQPIAIANKLYYTQAHCYVCHTPVRSNFWHFSVRWKIGEEDIEDVLSSKERRDLLGFVCTFLIEHAMVKTPDVYPLIPGHWYRK